MNAAHCVCLVASLASASLNGSGHTGNGVCRRGRECIAITDINLNGHLHRTEFGHDPDADAAKFFGAALMSASPDRAA